MPSPRNPNLEILLLAANRLGPLVDEMVFLGGCVTGLLVTDSAAPPIRPTKDVDVISEVLSRSDYYRLADKLRELGFREDSSEEAPLCRWIIEGVLLDVMPTDASILGFGNPWYQQALVHARSEEVAPGLTIKVVTAPFSFVPCGVYCIYIPHKVYFKTIPHGVYPEIIPCRGCL